MKTILLTLAVTLFSSASFAGRIDIAPEGNRLTKPGLISLWADWIKNKGDKFDIGFHMTNESKKNIIVKLGDMQCFRGNVRGELRGEKAMDFRPGELKNLVLVCKVGEKVKGEYKIIVRKVSENPSGDGKTIGKELAKEIEWKVDIAED